MRRILLALAVCASVSFALVGSAQAAGTSLGGNPVTGTAGGPGVGHDPTYLFQYYNPAGEFVNQDTGHLVKETTTTGRWYLLDFCDAGSYVKGVKGALTLNDECTGETWYEKKVKGVKPAEYFGYAYYGSEFRGYIKMNKT